MRHSRCTLYISLATAIAILLASASFVLAQTLPNHDLSWHVIGGGGGRMASAKHTILNTVGQPATGQMSSGSHALCSGFWCSTPAGYRIYLPLVLRNYH